MPRLIAIWGLRSRSRQAARGDRGLHKALSLKPDYAEAHKNLSFAFLNVGELKKVWRNMNGAGKVKRTFYKSRFSVPLWDGQKKLQGKRIYFGAARCRRYNKLVFQAAANFVTSTTLYLGMSEKLVPLLTRSFPNIELKPVTKVEICKEMTLIFICHWAAFINLYSTNSEQPKPDAFLVPDQARSALWKKRLMSLGPGPYIGVSWKSSDMSPKRLPNYAL